MGRYCISVLKFILTGIYLIHGHNRVSENRYMDYTKLSMIQPQQLYLGRLDHCQTVLLILYIKLYEMKNYLEIESPQILILK